MNEHELEKSAEALNETENPAPVAEEVETDALTDALDTLAKAMNKDSYKKAEMDAKPDMDEEDMKKGEDMDKAEMDAEDMDKADMEESKDAEESDDDFIDLEEMMKEMADNTDRIVSEMKEDMAALLKGVEALLGEMKAMKAEQGNMNKSLNAVASAPVPPRAVTSAPVHPSTVVPPQMNRGEMISKALTKLQDPNTDASTRYRLRTVVAQLEAGAPLTQFSDLG